MTEYYNVERIWEDDFGCEERPAEYEPQVIVVLKDAAGKEHSLKQADAWLYQQEIREGDAVYLEEGRLREERINNTWRGKRLSAIETSFVPVRGIPGEQKKASSYERSGII